MILAKHHGLGNDFLVLIDLEAKTPVDAERARALCDRHRGVGADGVIRVTRAGGSPAEGSPTVTMELRNADGSQAEMSGNGIRCLAHAVVDAGVVDQALASKRGFVVGTPSGPRSVVVLPGASPGEVGVRVTMGRVALGREDAGIPGWRARRVSMGNPHLVLLADDVGSLDVAGLAAPLERSHGVNVEFVAPEAGELALRTWERGVGETLACGTGSVAAAAAARGWGLVEDEVAVRNPGGRLQVDLSSDEAVLCGPSQRVAAVELCW